MTSAQSLSDSIPSSVITCFQALSPRATRTAMIEIDNHLKSNPTPAPDELAPGTNVNILQSLVTVLVHASRFVCVSVGDNNIVTFRDVEYDANSNAMTIVGDEGREDNTNEAFCNCRAFTFRARDETYCHHVIIAAIAVSLRVAPIEHVSKDTFMSLLNKE